MIRPTIAGSGLCKKITDSHRPFPGYENLDDATYHSGIRPTLGQINRAQAGARFVVGACATATIDGVVSTLSSSADEVNQRAPDVSR